jgi:hypothetical protein
MCIKDWADYVGIKPNSMRKRLDKGWPLDKAFAVKPVDELEKIYLPEAFN